MGPWLHSGFGTVHQIKKYVCSIARSICHAIGSAWSQMHWGEICAMASTTILITKSRWYLSGYSNDIRMIFDEMTHLSFHFIPAILHRNLQPSPSYSKYPQLPHLLTLRRDYRRSSFHQSLPEAGRLYKTMWWLHRQNAGSQIPVKDYRSVSCLKLTPKVP